MRCPAFSSSQAQWYSSAARVYCFANRAAAARRNCFSVQETGHSILKDGETKLGGDNACITPICADSGESPELNCGTPL